MAQLPVHPKNSNFDDVAQAADVNGDQYLNDSLATLWARNDHPTTSVTVMYEEMTPCDHPHHYKGWQSLIPKTVTIFPGQLVDMGPVPARWSTDSDRQTKITYQGALDVSGSPSFWVAVFAGY